MTLNTTYQSAVPSRPKILMLHGNGQSGQMLQCKTKFLMPQVRDTVANALQQDPCSAPIEMVEFHYPSSKLPSKPDQNAEESNHLWVWARGEYPDDPAWGLEQSVSDIFHYLDENGPFLGIMGFSMGAATAAIVASLLEKRRSIGNFQFNTNHPPLKFVVAVCGFTLGHPIYDDLYSPKIETPIFLAIASIDVSVAESESLRLRDSSTNTALYFFEGTHHVPRDGRFLESLTQFIEDVLGGKGAHEEDWEDCGDY
ncbi:Serine hydrolase FSH [Penicillium concentricum]|uniref:Serine hydrolase FSH n=1 Tax=Penicillium concentricum TaxID=293559 RepID=A0A9W9RJN7_9EURO|nr:Serine hydrolase FSH [Penicillium concentricum]KAJ5360795.1 Serine hydrolase FSH [Penicillium concentricum]